jgi:hypothetical protein
MLKRVLLGCTLLCACAAAGAAAAEDDSADVLTLKDGRVLEGRVVVSTDRDMLFRTTDGTVHKIRTSEIESHRRGSRTSPAIGSDFRCEKCRDTGEVVCPDCGGSGRAACRSCGGEKHTPCPACGGKHFWTRSYFPGKPPRKPQMTMGSGRVKCRDCGGDGKLHVPRIGGGLVEADCPHCRRTGSVNCGKCFGRGWVPCAFCGATGRDPDAPCPRCAAKGRIPCGCGQRPGSGKDDDAALGCKELLESLRRRNTHKLVGRRFRLPRVEVDYVARRAGRPEVVILLKLEGQPPGDGKPPPAVEVYVYVAPAKGGEADFEKLAGGDTVTGEASIEKVEPGGGKNDPVILSLKDARLQAVGE